MGALCSPTVAPCRAKARRARSTVLTHPQPLGNGRIGQAGSVRPLVCLQPDLGPPPRKGLARARAYNPFQFPALVPGQCHKVALGGHDRLSDGGGMQPRHVPPPAVEVRATVFEAVHGTFRHGCVPHGL